MRLATVAVLLFLAPACNEGAGDQPDQGSGRNEDLSKLFTDEPDMSMSPGDDLAGEPDMSLPPLMTLSFGAPAIIPAAEWPVDVVAADFNMDGRMDLVVALIRTKELLVLLGKGDGTFQKGVSVPLVSAAGALA